MNDKDRRELIEEKKAEIAKLQAQINELKMPPISEMVKEMPMSINYRGYACKASPSVNDAYKEIMQLGRGLFRFRGTTRPKIKELSDQQIKQLARFMDDVIAAYNRMWEEIHNG